MNIEEARTILQENCQEHLLNFWETLNPGAQENLLAQIAELDFRSIGRMRELLEERGGAVDAVDRSAPVPPKVLELDGETRTAAVAAGEEVLRSGSVGILLVAGGQGSRLGYEGPKGAYSIGPATGSSLFYFHARKILGLSRKYGVRIPFYIMTSEVNDAATREHFENHAFFGLNPDDVIFFTQCMWPALDPDGRILMDRPDHIFMSPDGHGGTLSALLQRGCLEDMRKRGIKTVFFFQVDNPLIEIADPAFIGVHVREQADISVKLCLKREPMEGLGVVVERDGHCEMVEYSEFHRPENHALLELDENDELLFRYGSVAIHVFSYDFLSAEAVRDMPLHVAHKKIPVCNAEGLTVAPEKPNGYKFEKFIFDVLPDAKKVVNMAFDRSEEFSPVKNAAGADSPATCRRDLQLKWLRWFNSMGVQIPLDESGLPVFPIEIDPAYALNEHDLRERGISLRGCARPWTEG